MTNRSHAFIRRALLMSAVLVLGLAFRPVTAHATETLSATGSAWAVDSSAALQYAEEDAYSYLYDLALSRGETCTNVTYTTIGYYQVPGPPYGFWYEEQATGTCS